MPIGSAKTYGSSSSILRGDVLNQYNSPFNFVYITKKANKAISDKLLSVYQDQIQTQAKTDCFIPYVSNTTTIQDFLDLRFKSLTSDIETRVKKLM